MFLFNINVVGFKKHKLKNTNIWSRGGLQQNVFLIYEPVFCKMWKVFFFLRGGGIFWQFWLMLKKKTIKYVFQRIKKQKSKAWPLLEVTSEAKERISQGPSLVQHKNANLAPDITFKNLGVQRLVFKEGLKPLFDSVWQMVFMKKQTWPLR